IGESAHHLLFSPHPNSPTPPPRSFPTRRSSDLSRPAHASRATPSAPKGCGRSRRNSANFITPLKRGHGGNGVMKFAEFLRDRPRSEEHTSELQSRGHLVCRLLLEKKKKQYICII